MKYEYTLYDGDCLMGNQIETHANYSLDECMSLCDMRDDCKSFTYTTLENEINVWT